MKNHEKCPNIDTYPASCWYTWYTCPLSIHLLLVNMPTMLLIHSPCPPPVNMPTSCQYAHPVVNMLASWQYACHVVNTLATYQYTCLLLICPPPVDTPAMLLIHSPPVDMPAMLLIHPPCYWYTHLMSDMPTLGPIKTPALAVIVVGCGAADDMAGSIGAHIPQGGEGQGMSRWWWWSTCLAWHDSEVCIHQLCGTCGWWEEQWHWQLYCHAGDKGYFKSQYIKLVITF